MPGGLNDKSFTILIQFVQSTLQTISYVMIKVHT